MDDRQLKSIAIIGTGVSAWLTAAGLAKRLESHKVRIDIIGPAPENRDLLAAAPATSAYHREVGIDQGEFLRETGSAFTLGTRYLNWTHRGQDYIHTYSPAGRMRRAVGFHHYVNLLRLQGEDVSFDGYSRAACAARQRRFGIGAQEHRKHDPCPLIHGFQIDERRYCNYLARRAGTLGVVHTGATVTDVVLRPETGHIASLRLDDGRALEADFFFDCGDGLSTLLRDTLGVGVANGSELFPADRRATLVMPMDDHTPPYSTLRRESGGWSRTVSIPGWRWRAYYYSSDHIGDAEVARTLAGGPCAASTDGVTFTTLPQPGVLAAFWRGNCVAIGAAAGIFGDFSISAQHLAQSSLLRWLDLYPDRSCDPVLADEYNRLAGEETARIRDVHLLHFRLADTDSAFWRQAAAIACPESLLYKIDVFERTGVLPYYESETLTPEAWIALLLGMGCWPDRCDALLNGEDPDDIREELAKMARTAAAEASALPLHDTFLRHLAAAEPAVPPSPAGSTEARP